MSAKKDASILAEMLRLFRSGENYYLAKSMDLFYDLSAKRQKGLLEHICEKQPDVANVMKWDERLTDNTLYPDVVRSILYYFSGRRDANQPSVEQLRILVGEYARTVHEEAKGKKKEEFMKELKRT